MKKHSLGALQLEIMQVLWERGEASASDVHQDLMASKGLAPTTIATMLKKMEVKGIVEHRTEGRRFVYRPCISEDSVTRTMVGDLMQRLFSGQASALVAHLVTEHNIAPDDFEKIQEILSGVNEEAANNPPQSEDIQNNESDQKEEQS